MQKFGLKISGKHYRSLQNHLFPGDGKEAVSVLLCGRFDHQNDSNLLVHKVIHIPYEECKVREPNLVVWSTSVLEQYLDLCVKRNWAIVKIHSHPTGYRNFSETDDQSDVELYSSIYGWMDSDSPHGSAIMLPNGEIFGRIIFPDLSMSPINKTSVIGNDLKFWPSQTEVKNENYDLRTRQAFGEGTTNLLKQLKIGIVGCSGTGSPVVEQLARLGVGELLLIDPDEVEEKNLNRILNTTIDDAKNKRKKVDVIARAINNMGLGNDVIPIAKNIYDNISILKELSTCDIIFGCVDSVDGRHLLNQISTFYLVAYFDLGVKLIANMEAGIEQICGTVHYIQPGGSSLKTRGLYTNEELRAAGLFRTNPKEYEEQKKYGYIANINVDSPAVISVNMQIASIAVNELLARIHPYRHDENSEFAVTRISLSDSYMQYDSDGDPDEYLAKYIGRGDIKPLLNMPEFS